MAPGTALVQRRFGGEGISIAVGGEAGAAEGDFETCLNWSTRPGNYLPVLIAVTNNGWGISTDVRTVQGGKRVADRAIPYGIECETVNGNDPIATWHAIDRAMRYCRKERKPFLLEAVVSRLHGHSSSSGAQRNWNEADTLALFEQKLIDAGAIDVSGVKALKDEAKAEADAAVVETMREAQPTPEDVEKFTYAPSPVDAVYPNDYTGLPGRR
jgi:2-oxoisovalerate dehydrogenase E1 component alpha subunit